MGLVTELPTTRHGDLKIAIAEWGLVQGYVCVAAGEQPLKFAPMDEVHAAIRECAANTHWPKADTLYCHDAPGELGLLVKRLGEPDKGERGRDLVTRRTQEVQE